MLAQLGPLVTALAGSMGGTTFQRHPVGTLIRRRPLPTRRRTQYTNAERATIQEMTRTWRTLTAQQRDDWDTVARSLVWTNKFGQVIGGKGYWLFLRVNGIRQVIGAAPVLTVGTVAALGTIVGLETDYNPQTEEMQVRWTSGAVPAGETWLVFATPPMSAGISYPNPHYRFVQEFETTTATGENIGPAYILRHGRYPETGQIFYVRVLPVLNSWYLPGTPEEALGTVL